MASLKAAILTILDREVRGKQSVNNAPLCTWLADRGVKAVKHALIPNEVKVVSGILAEWADSSEVDLILPLSGSGTSTGDVTPLATRSILEREITAFEEVMRNKNLAVTPEAFLRVQSLDGW